MSKPDDYLWDRSGSPDPDVARLEQLLAPLAHDRPLDELGARRARGARRWWIAGAVAAVAAAAVLAIVLRPRTTASPSTSPTACFAGSGAGTGMTFVAHGAPVACSGAPSSRGMLAVGSTLDTGAGSAELAIADIGTARLFEGSRV